MTDATEIRRRLNESLDAQRERLDRIDDTTLVNLVDHLRGLVPSRRFNPVEFFAEWLFGPVPVLSGLTPARDAPARGRS